MRKRLPTILSIVALVVAVLGSTSFGRAAIDAAVPLAKRAYLADTAKNALRPSVKFAALDPKRQQDFTTNFAIGIVSAVAGETLREHARKAIVPYRSDPTVTIVGSPNDFVQLPGGQAWRLRVRIAGAANGGGTVSLLQYHVLRNRRFYIFSYVTLRTLEGKYAQTFAKSAGSIRFSS